MSAHILENSDLKNIIQAFGKIAGLSINQKTSLFNLLHSENVISVNYRYVGSKSARSGSIEAIQAYKPECLNAEDFLKVEFEELTRGAALSRLTSLIYQSCEHESYFDSQAYAVTQRIGAALISGIDEPEKAKRNKTVYRNFSSFHRNEEYICIYSEAEEVKNCFEFTAGGLKPANKRINYLSFNPDTNKTIEHCLGEHILAKKIENECDFSLSAEQLENMLLTAKKEHEEQLKQHALEAKKAEEEKAAFMDQLKAIYQPENHKGYILAEFEVSDCDIMTDYFNVKTEKRIILSFSNHGRALIPEMRKAILNSGLDIPDLLELAEKNEKFEDRSGGYYGNKVSLKNGSAYSTGWRVSKVKVHSENCFYVSEFAPALVAAPVKESEPALNIQGITIEEHTHTKKGFQMFICICPQMSKEDYFKALDQARNAGGWYSRKWGTTPGGFAFKDKASAEAFAQSLDVSSAPETSKEETKKEPAKITTNHAEKLRGLADKLQKQIDDKRGPRLTNTPKRLKEANQARNEAERLERTQKALYALADLHQAGNVPAMLAGFNSKKAVYDAMAEKNDLIQNGFHCYYSGTGKPASNTPEVLALWDLLEAETEERKAEKELQAKVESLQFSNIPGYFPTPKSVINLMLENAGIKAGDLVLEPSAGSGAILDAIKEHEPGAKLECCEVNFSLREILKLKGYSLVENSCLELTQGGYDAVVMNPPFENLQDVDHIKHAFSLLKPGGRLVAIMSPGAFFRMDKKSEAFRSWFYSLNGLETDLPENSFKQSGTGVNTKMIVLSK